MAGDYILGIDLGTSSVKAALFGAPNLALIAEAACQYPVHHPQPGYAEQDPHDWWAGTITAVGEARAQAPHGEIIAIGLAGQMHGLVCLNAQQKPLRPAIIWADTRATAEVAELSAFQQECPATMPGPPAAGYTAVSAFWLSRHEPHILSQTRTILSPKDYVRLRLTGLAGTDPSDAAGMWLFDLAAKAWAEDIVARCGLQIEQLPPVMASSAVCGTLTHLAAQELGLHAGLPVVTGSADLPAQALGHGIIDPSAVLVTVGTGGQVFRPRLDPQPDPQGRLYLFPHNVPDRWYAQAAILAGGLSLRRLRDILGLTGRADAYDHLSSLASGVPAGAEGLLFLPYLAGERTPYNDPQAAGLFLGLRLHHGPGHLARAVLEGVGFALLDCLHLLDDGTAAITLSGGVTRSAIWPQILASIWQRPLSIPAAEVPRACLGAAILAGVGVGLFQDGREGTAVRPEPATIIQPEAAPIYQDRYAQYRRLYPLLKEEMHHLTSPVA